MENGAREEGNTREKDWVCVCQREKGFVWERNIEIVCERWGEWERSKEGEGEKWVIKRESGEYLTAFIKFQLYAWDTLNNKPIMVHLLGYSFFRWRHDTRHNDTQHSSTLHANYKLMRTFSIGSQLWIQWLLLLSGVTMSVAFRIIMLSVILLNVVQLNVVASFRYISITSNNFD